ncbi:MAG: helix-turn-helix transcriptional regulator [Actinomycetota bacterium]
MSEAHGLGVGRGGEVSVPVALRIDAGPARTPGEGRARHTVADALAALAVAAAMAYALSVVTGWGRPEHAGLLDHVVFDAVPACAAAVLYLRARSGAGDRTAWTFICAACAAGAVSSILFSVFAGSAPSGALSAADAPKVVGYLAGAVGLWLLLRPRLARLGAPDWRETAAAALATAALAVAVVAPAGRSETWASLGVWIAYPLVDLLLAALGAGVVAGYGMRLGIVPGLLTVTVVLMAGADLGYVRAVEAGGWAPGGPLDALWPAGWALAAVAGAVARRDDPAGTRRAGGGGRLIAPTAIATLAASGLVIVGVGAGPAWAGLLSGASLVLVLIHLAGAARERGGAAPGGTLDEIVAEACAGGEGGTAVVAVDLLALDAGRAALGDDSWRAARRSVDAACRGIAQELGGHAVPLGSEVVLVAPAREDPAAIVARVRDATAAAAPEGARFPTAVVGVPAEADDSVAVVALLGERLDAARRQARRQEAADVPGGVTGPAPAGLTEREVRILELVARGHTNKEIGQALYVSPRTVARSLERAFDKLGAANRAHAIQLASERGLL